MVATMYTLIVSPIFSRLWPDYWSEDERGKFAAWLAQNLEAGDVVPGSGGIRKVRWSREGQGKRAGVRIIYYNQPGESLIWLLTIYAKSRQENAPAHILKALKEELING